MGSDNTTSTSLQPNILFYNRNNIRAHKYYSILRSKIALVCMLLGDIDLVHILLSKSSYVTKWHLPVCCWINNIVHSRGVNYVWETHFLVVYFIFAKKVLMAKRPQFSTVVTLFEVLGITVLVHVFLIMQYSLLMLVFHPVTANIVW